MGIMRRGKSGLKRYLLDRLHRVKEVFRNEVASRDELQAKDMETQMEDKVDETTCEQSHEEESVPHGTQGRQEEPPELLPTPSPERNQVLRVQHRPEPITTTSPTTSPKGPKEYVDSAGRRQVTWTDKGMKKGSESDGNMYMDDDDFFLGS